MVYLDPWRPYHLRIILTMNLCSRILKFAVELGDDLKVIDDLAKKRDNWSDLTEKVMKSWNIRKTLRFIENALDKLARIIIDADTLLYRDINQIEKRIVEPEKHIRVELHHDAHILEKEKQELKDLLKKHKEDVEPKELKGKKSEIDSLSVKVDEEATSDDELKEISHHLHNELGNVLCRLDDEAKAYIAEIPNQYTMWNEWSISGDKRLRGFIRKKAIELGTLLKKLKSIQAPEKIEGIISMEIKDAENIIVEDRILMKRLEDHIKGLRKWGVEKEAIEIHLQRLEEQKKWLRYVALREKKAVKTAD